MLTVGMVRSQTPASCIPVWYPVYQYGEQILPLEWDFVWDSGRKTSLYISLFMMIAGLPDAMWWFAIVDMQTDKNEGNAVMYFT